MVSINELLDALRTVAKGDFVARYAEPRSGDIQESGANIDRFTKTFGYEPKMTLAEGLQETMRS